MGRLTRKEELFHLAYQLAYFVHRRKGIAIKVATEAMLLLDVASAAQARRFYYRPRTRHTRSKVFLNDTILLQRLVYIQSEPYEKLQEEGEALTEIDEEDMLVRYVTYLARITVKRNSFYVALGMCRFVYEYGFAETRSLYEFLMQDSKRYKGEDYYRRCKLKLKNEISGRFVNFLRITEGLRGEEHFEIEEHPDRHAKFLLSCLKVCTPWRTKCVLPEHFDPGNDLMPTLSFSDTDPDNEHPIEMNRIHSLLHPRCFSRLIKSLNFEVPDNRLAIPHFIFIKDNKAGGPKGDRHNPPVLGREEMEDFRHALDEQAALRRKSSRGLVSIKVDGVERGRLDLRVENKVCVEIEEGDELIEVVNVQNGRELPLATCLLSFAELHSNGGTLTSAVTLEGGQRLKFIISLATQRDGEETDAFVYVTYEENQLQRAASIISHGGRRIVDRCSQLAIPQVATLIFIISSLTIVFSFQQIRGDDAAPVSPRIQVAVKQADAVRMRRKQIESTMYAVEERIEVESRRLKHNPYDVSVEGRQNDAIWYAAKLRGLP